MSIAILPFEMVLVTSLMCVVQTNGYKQLNAKKPGTHYSNISCSNMQGHARLSMQ